MDFCLRKKPRHESSRQKTPPLDATSTTTALAQPEPRKHSHRQRKEREMEVKYCDSLDDDIYRCRGLTVVRNLTIMVSAASQALLMLDSWMLPVKTPTSVIM